ncbi:hypothetical protein M1L60_19085 [Actinoplanes sp. TRM 88003]|uniref:Adhesin domain-containing protein n=1 Tax=Paractinoplanes aksuensis TaxID=2939490 RepID=A0ABT1DPE0_9ACTN|nr:hypothetical protein [Actinoplanes aksuensis]MCO8272702.1 hypothetical protein [Actinoplanes aksuensis]
MWFGDAAATTTGETATSTTTTGETPAVTTPDHGPATPGGSRISFGFTSGPISPVRHPASPTSPAAPAAPAPAPASAETTPSDLPVRRVTNASYGFGSGSSGAGAGAGFGSPAFESTGEQRRFDTTGEQRRFDTTGEQRRFDRTGEQRRISDTGEQRRVADTGEFRRFLDANEPTGAPEVADRRSAPPPPRAATVTEPPRQSRAVTVGIVLMSLVVLIAGGIVGVVYFTGNNDDLDSVLQLGAGESGKRTVTAPLDNRNQASFEMLAATNRVNLSIGELGDDLYRISSPEDAGFLPSPVLRNDDLKLQVTKDGDGTGGVIDVVLAAKVRWSVRLSGYAEEQVIDLSGGQVSGIEMVGGMRTAELTLARPDGTVPIKVNGAVEKLVVRSPSGSPVRVKVNGGAKTVVAGNRTIKDVPPGSTLTPKNWAVPNRYDVGAGAPITALTVENG